MKKLNGNTYIYDIIDNLSARLYETEFLFNITELFSKADCTNTKKITTLKKINRILNLQIDYLKNYKDEILTTNDIRIIISDKKENNHDKKEFSFILFGTSINYLYCISLYIPSIDQFKNKLYIDESLTVSTVYIKKEIIRLEKDKEHIKEFEVRLSLNNKGEILVNLLKNRSNIMVHYLDMTYDDRTKNLINKKKGEHPNLTIAGLRESFPELNRAVSDSKNWRYTLNFRGFLLFLIGISNIFNKKIMYKRIKEVISNERIKELAPFLQYWDIFEKEGFPVIKLVIKIADELKDQLHYETTDLSNNNSYLLKRATERYFIRWIDYFDYIWISVRGLYKKINIQESDFKIFQEYKIKILNFLKASYENDIKSIKRLLKAYHNDCSSFSNKNIQ